MLSRTKWLRIPVSNMNNCDFVAKLTTELRASSQVMDLVAKDTTT